MSERAKVEFTLEAFRDAEHECWEAFRVYQKAQNDLDIIQETEKDYLLQLMNKQDGPNESSKQRMARCSDEWKVFRRGQFEAIRACGDAKVRYQSAIRAWETIQSGLSYRKEEMKKLGSS